MSENVKYIIQVFKYGRWNKTSWTRQGKAVSLKAANKAVVRARERFPQSLFRIRIVKDGRA